MLGHPPRLADFALLVSAREQALGTKPNEAMAASRANCAEARDLPLEASPVCILASTGFQGTMVQLLAQLNGLVGDGARRSPAWPKTPSSLVTRCGEWRVIYGQPASNLSSTVSTVAGERSR